MGSCLDLRQLEASLGKEEGEALWLVDGVALGVADGVLLGFALGVDQRIFLCFRFCWCL